MILTLKYRTNDRIEWTNAFGTKQRGRVLSVDGERLRVRPDGSMGPNVSVEAEVSIPLPRVLKEGE